MAQQSKDTLGDRLKEQEQLEAGRKCDPTLPLMCRLDGRAFHTFTKGLRRPYDMRLSDLMIDTAAYLVDQTHALLGYSQSDEISLCWLPSAMPGSQYFYDGKFQKLTSVLAGMASAYFNRELVDRIPEKAECFIPVFDARVWNVPTAQDAYLNFLWRQDDAIKNSISMAAQAHFSAKTLHGVGSEQKKQMLRDIDCPWEEEEDYFKWGTFIQRVTKMVTLTDEQLAGIPEAHRPIGPVMRTVVEVIDLEYIKNDPRGRFIFGLRD